VVKVLFQKRALADIAADVVRSVAIVEKGLAAIHGATGKAALIAKLVGGFNVGLTYAA